MRFLTIVLAASLTAATPAFAADVVGSTSGVFLNPAPSSAVVSGVGTNQVKIGTPASSTPANQLTFTGASFSSPLETQFKIGSLNYFNGSVYDPADSIDLSIKLNFLSPALGAVTNLFKLNFTNTNNTGNPDADADYLYFPSTFSSSSFLIDGTTYRVQLTGFGNIKGDGFLASNTSELHVRENASASADLFAVVTSRTSGSAVPEPASWALMITGFAVVGYAMRRRPSVRMNFA
jgi:hypothetical protein